MCCSSYYLQTSPQISHLGRVAVCNVSVHTPHAICHYGCDLKTGLTAIEGFVCLTNRIAGVGVPAEALANRLVDCMSTYTLMQ